jgi:hypothetical protein
MGLMGVGGQLSSAIAHWIEGSSMEKGYFEKKFSAQKEAEAERIRLEIAERAAVATEAQARTAHRTLIASIIANVMAFFALAISIGVAFHRIG